MAEVFYISNWNVKSWIQTVGTREKCFVENPADGKLYFFKKSIHKYQSEFWSEIIASKVGAILGFQMLDYNVAILENHVGCLCEFMIDPANEELEHGVALLKNSNPDFKVTKRPVILFEYVERSFMPYSGFIHTFIDILIFDCIIGNQDRHSENWAIIRSLDVENIEYNKQRFFKWAHEKYKKAGLPLSKIPFKKFFLQIMNEASLINVKLSPIYDSGSSLGREIPEDNIQEFLDNPDKIKKYIKNGLSEIKWDGAKINHFDLLRKVQQKYPEQVKKTVNRVIEKFDSNQLNRLIDNIDANIVSEYEHSKLSLRRKQLIIKFVELRIQALKEIIN